MNSKVTVVIPLFNQGKYIDETLRSVQYQTYGNIEIIIVNDGSTDSYTLRKIEELHKKGIKILHKINGGLSSARNVGIAEATGKYIVTLDSDDLIDKHYIETLVEAISLSDNRIVYSQALLFDERKGLWMLPKYSLLRMLRGNIIFCSAIYHREDWVLSGGYDESMKGGLEDWDFWLSIIERGGKVTRIEKPLFHYRIRRESMLRSLDNNKKVKIVDYIYAKHKDLFERNSVARDSIIIEENNNLFYRVANKAISVLLGVIYARKYRV